MTEDVAVVYLVAGLAGRFGGTIKQLARVGCRDETLIEISVNQAIDGGIGKVLFVVGDKTEDPFRKKFGDNYNGVPVLYARQEFDPETRDRPWGTADAVCAARHIIDCPFVVCNGDDLYGQEAFALLLNHLEEEEDEATLGYRLSNVLPEFGRANRAIFEVENTYVKGLAEHFHIAKNRLEEEGLNPDALCSMNIFALHPKTLDYLEEEMWKLKESLCEHRMMEFLLPDELATLITKKKIKMKIYPVDTECIGITNPGDEEIVKQKLAEKKEGDRCHTSRL